MPRGSRPSNPVVNATTRCNHEGPCGHGFDSKLGHHLGKENAEVPAGSFFFWFHGVGGFLLCNTTTRSSGVDETPDVIKHVCKTAHVRSVVGHRNVLCGTIGKVSAWSFDRYIGSDESRELGGAVAVSV